MEQNQLNTRVNVFRGPFGLWFTLQYQVEVDNKWWTLDTYRARSLKTKPRDAEAWVWGYLYFTGVLAEPKLYGSVA